MVLLTRQMQAPPTEQDGRRICVMSDARVYNRQLVKYASRYGRKMYDDHLKTLAPPLELKDAYIYDGLPWEQYVPWFTREVIERQDGLIALLAHFALESDMTFLCSEASPAYCHRRLLAEACKRHEPTLELRIA